MKVAEIIMPSHLNYNERKALEDIVRKIPPVYAMTDEILLYGSKARGDFAEESDLDILFVVRADLTSANKHEIYDALYAIEVENDVVVSAVFASISDLAAEKTQFLRRVRKEGITLWSRG